MHAGAELQRRVLRQAGTESRPNKRIQETGNGQQRKNDRNDAKTRRSLFGTLHSLIYPKSDARSHEPTVMRHSATSRSSVLPPS